MLVDVSSVVAAIASLIAAGMSLYQWWRERKERQ